MNLSMPKRFIIITAILYILMFAIAICSGFFQFEPKNIDLYFRSGWILNNALIMFFAYIVPVQCLAVLLTFSVFIPNRAVSSEAQGTTNAELNRNVTIVVCILIVLTAIFFTGKRGNKIPRTRQNYSL